MLLAKQLCRQSCRSREDKPDHNYIARDAGIDWLGQHYTGKEGGYLNSCELRAWLPRVNGVYNCCGFGMGGSPLFLQVFEPNNST